MPQTVDLDRRRDDRVASRRGARARRRGGAHPPPRGPRPVRAGRRARRPQVRAAPADRRLQDPRAPTTPWRGWSPEAGRAGVVTASSGNHGQALAFAARRFGLRAVVVMPESTPQVKVDGVRRHGGEVVLAGATRSAEQGARAEAIARDEGPHHDSALRPSRRDRGAGHDRPRDPGAAARRRDHPGAGERRRPHRRHLGGRGGARARPSRSWASSPRARPSSPPRSPPAPRRRWRAPRAWPTGSCPGPSAP